MSPLSFAELEELERRVASRDRAAFSALHRAYWGLLHQFVLNRTGNPRQTDKIVDQIFETAWDRVDRYRWQDFSFHVWLLRIARDFVPASR